MNFPPFAKSVTLVCFALITAGQAPGCQCGAKFHGKSNLEEAKLEADDATAIFEGTAERLELQWDALQAPEGARISATALGGKHGWGPYMLVTFRVSRTYKGALGPTVQIKTGLGGGDCGAVYSPGLTYLVFGNGPSLGDLGVGMCSPGGWIASPSLAAELRYLRKEAPTTSDVSISRSSGPNANAVGEAKRRRDSEEFQKRYAAATGKICGKVHANQATDEDPGNLSFLSTAGYSPLDHPRANIDPDGSFCSGFLAPGEYYLYFSRGSLESPGAAIYYPGVADKVKATKVLVEASRTSPKLTFNVPAQQAYSVRGIISTNDKSGVTANNVFVSLTSMEGIPYLFAHSKAVDFEGSFPLPKVKYFDIENVLPGRYLAYVSVLGQGWYTKKEIVNVTTHSKFISLELEHTDKSAGRP